jgi:hypothetical protein
VGFAFAGLSQTDRSPAYRTLIQEMSSGFHTPIAGSTGSI